MKKMLAAMLSAAIVSFSGCSRTKTAIVPNTQKLQGKDVSTYLQGEYVDVTTAKKKLKEAGYEIVAVYTPIKNAKTIIFTDDTLKAEGAKPGRAYASILRLFVDEKEKKISFTNPIYFGKAFMQDQYDHAVFASELAKINKTFPNLKDSVDKLKFDELSKFHFMIGMPYYNEPDELAKGETDSLVTKATTYKRGKLEVFKLKLSGNSYLLGYDLGRKTKKFVQKIGRANAILLPWCIKIEDGVASTLNAKYYIALSYPLLTMNDFMGIATIPSTVEKDLEKIFK